MPVFNNDIIFLHIPRTGGTLIEDTLKKKMKIKFIGPDKNGLSLQHYTLNNILTNLESKNYLTFTFVRNPFDKILSSYLNWTIDNTPNFDDYINMVKEVVDKKLYLNISHIKTNDISHYIPQYIMIGNNKLDFIGRFEDYETDIIKLSKYKNLNNLSSINIKKNNINYREYYNNRNRKIIEDLYKEDLKLFNYTF